MAEGARWVKGAGLEYPDMYTAMDTSNHLDILCILRSPVVVIRKEDHSSVARRPQGGGVGAVEITRWADI